MSALRYLGGRAHDSDVLSIHLNGKVGAHMIPTYDISDEMLDDLWWAAIERPWTLDKCGRGP